MSPLFALQVDPHPIRLGVEDIHSLFSLAYILSALEARLPSTALIIYCALTNSP